MKKKKGFTLIELLGVIVVLTVILIIAVPKILDVIEQAEKKAYKESVELMAHTAQIQYKTNEVTGTSEQIPEEGIVYEFENGEYKGEKTLNFKGDKPFSGTITLTKNKKVIIEKLVSKNKKWCAIKEEGEKSARVGRSTDPGFECIVEPDKPIVDKKACELEKNIEIINGEEKEVFYVDSVCDMYEFSYIVNNEKNFSGQIVKLRNDLDMSDIEKISDKLTEKYGITDFSPIGTGSSPFSGTFDGGAKVISNLTINKPSQNNVGLFGYVTGDDTNQASIYGVRINNETINGKVYVGGLVGYIGSYSIVKEIELDNINISGGSAVGGLVGATYDSRGAQTINNILVKTGVVSGNGTGLIYGNSGYYAYKNFTNSIVENVTMNCSSDYYYTAYNGYNMYYSNNITINGNKVTDGYEEKGIDDINFYEATGLDTWIGGDNDSTGYYFDYDNSGKVILKSTKLNPITFNLSKDSEGYYLINNEKDYKEASSRPSEKYKLMSNLDFSTNKYYMLGSSTNIFNGHIDGNDNTINNVEISGSKVNYLGMIGYVYSGKVYGLVLNNIKVHGYNCVGIIGQIDGTSGQQANIYGIRINNETINGNDYVGGLTGYIGSYSIVKEIELDNINISGGSAVGGLVGSTYDSRGAQTINNILIKTGVVSGNSTGLIYGNSGYYAYKNFTNSIVENVTMNCSNSCYTTNKGNNTYHSNNITINGNKVTDGFDPSYIDDLTYYADVVETLFSGDSNNTGYFFDYVHERNGIHLVKAYPQSFTSPPDDDPDDPNTEGGGTPSEGSKCYITMTCNGSGKNRQCYVRYFENGKEESSVKNSVANLITKGSTCAASSTSASLDRYVIYVTKLSTASTPCSVTLRVRSQSDCKTTTYKTLTFQ